MGSINNKNNKIVKNGTTDTKSIKSNSVVRENGTDNEIEPDRFYAPYGSYWYIYYWKFDHYEPVSGPVIGIWPNGNMWNNSFIAELKNKWGFTGILISTSNQHQTSINAGFNFKYMMVRVNPDNYQERIGNLNYQANTYYSDEPFHVVCDPDEYKHSEWVGKLYMLSIIRDYANAHGAKYAISHYFDCSHVLEYAKYVDLLMYDGYRSMDLLLSCCFVSYSEDQRSTLSRWLNEFGNKASRFWVGTGITASNSDNDDNEFAQLFEWANNHGYFSGGQVWLYAGSSANENNISLFVQVLTMPGG